ncbi:MAG: hypothetical protein M1823_004596 [Watsoniomyces obsoletus]|nr:MAG: hypothetical protein M1823_004596 [Watsoniomyces obsoletus]
MRIIKPSWLVHGGERKDFEVYSCHISPDGARLATAAGDGHVRIWSVEAILNAGDPQYTKPKQLASLSHHSGTIHTVRFASNNRYLASGADDKIVCVYTLEPGPPPGASSFGTNETAPTEHWRVYRRLIGHDNDIQDLAWAPDSSILVSVGLDSKVVIWSGHTFEKLKTLSHHQSHVKGVTFDPANKYLATAADDRTLKIFRFTPPTATSTAHDQAHNFVLEANTQAPFASSPLTTYFRRLSWSPEGSCIAAPNAVNGPLSTAVIVYRGNWSTDVHLIGHEGPIEVCAFSPRLYDLSKSDLVPQGNDRLPPVMSICACGGQDKALSLWATGQPRPILVAFDLTWKSIADIAWHPDGRTLFVTSLDGSISAVTFGHHEIGRVVELEENEKSIAKYGTGRRGAGLVDGTTALLLEERSKAGEMTRVEGRMGELMGQETGDDSVEVPNGHAAAVTSSTEMVRPGHDPAPVPSEPVKESAPTNVTVSIAEKSVAEKSVAEVPAKGNNNTQVEKLKQRISYTKDGKKRLAPLLVSASPGISQPTLPKPQVMASAPGHSASNEPSGPPLDLSAPYDKLPQGGIASLLIGNKRKYAVPEGREEGYAEKRINNASRDGAIPILINGAEGLAPATMTTEPTVEATPEFLRPAVVDPSLTTSQLRLAVPKLRSLIVYLLETADGSSLFTPAAFASDLTMEVRNPAPYVPGRHLERNPARLTVSRGSQVLWQDFLARGVLLVTATPHFWAVACEEGSVYVWTPAGRRLLNAMVIESQAVIFESRGWYLLCITAVGMCHVWNLETLSAKHPPVSTAPILNMASLTLRNAPPHLQSGPSVTSARLTSLGQIVVTLSNGDGYTYSPTLLSWQRLSEAWWAVGSQYWNTGDSFLGALESNKDNDPEANRSAGIVSHLERHTTKEVLVKQRGGQLQKMVRTLFSREGYAGFESSVSIAHLEDRMAAALQLGARGDFRMNLFLYAKRIGAEGMLGKVEELLKTLMGGDAKDDDGKDRDENTQPSGDESLRWESHSERLCGWDRRELLKGVVLVLGKYRELQRITVPYARLLGITEDHEAPNPEAMVT